MSAKVDVIVTFRSPYRDHVPDVQGIRVGYCRAACGWRWQVEWVGGGTGNWSLAHYRTREVARDVAKCALNLGSVAA